MPEIRETKVKYDADGNRSIRKSTTAVCTCCLKPILNAFSSTCPIPCTSKPGNPLDMRRQERNGDFIYKFVRTSRDATLRADIVDVCVTHKGEAVALMTFRYGSCPMDNPIYLDPLGNEAVFAENEDVMRLGCIALFNEAMSI